MREFRFDSRYKAIDTAKWLNFLEPSKEYAICATGKGKFEVRSVEGRIKKLGMCLDIVPEDYSSMSYEHIASIYNDINPIQHMEVIRGMFSGLSNLHLRFILSEKLPLEKFIRMELANWGFNEYDTWVGFKQAEKVWLK